MPAGYVINTAGDVALTAATARTVLNFIAGTGAPIKLVEFGVSFDGITAGNEPVTVEICSSSQATAGTSTSVTPTQVRGQTRTVQGTAARSYTAEPTVLTVLKSFLIHPQGGGIVLQSPLGKEIEAAATDGIAIRLTAPDAVNAQAYMEVEEG